MENEKLISILKDLYLGRISVDHAEFAILKALEPKTDKELLQQAFEAGRKKIDHPDWDYIYENFEDWFKELEPSIAKALQAKHDQNKQLIELVERILLSFNYKHGETKRSTCMPVDEYESIRNKLLYIKTSASFSDKVEQHFTRSENLSIELFKGLGMFKAGEVKMKLGLGLVEDHPASMDCRIINESLYQEIVEILSKTTKTYGRTK